MQSSAIVEPISSFQKRMVSVYLLISTLLLIVMMIFGLLMLLAQGKIISLNPDIFYQFMTLHGTGMVGVAALGASAVMWYFLRQYVKLSSGIFIANLVMFLLGVVMVLVSVYPFQFAAGWTFLYPLPAKSVGAWGMTGAALYLGGMTVIGLGFLFLYLDVALAIIHQYGSLGKALGWPQIFSKGDSYGPPPAVVASTMVLIANITGLIAGATVLMMSLVNLFIPEVRVDPLLAKNLTYAFGHIFANAIIYMGVIGVYEILPKYTNRPWKSNRVFLIAWNFSTLFTIIIYPHHLLMDFAMPKWALILGQVLSYMNGFPVLVVTAYGALMLIYKSGIRWDMASGLMLLAMFGWVSGVVPAIVDATIVVNHVMHNTKWVPGHFHMYAGIGAISMIFGFMFYLNKHEAAKRENPIDRYGIWIYGGSFLGLTLSFLYAGKQSVPRRWAEHLPEWAPYDQIGAFFAIILIWMVLLFVIRFAANIKHMGSGTHA